MQTYPGRLQQITALSAADWGIVLISMILLPVTALMLRIKGYTWSCKFLVKKAKHNSVSHLTLEEHLGEAQRITHLVTIAANHGIYRANCLKKALVARWLLHSRGICVVLKIGVNNDSSEFSAHAWLEYNGHVLLDSTDAIEHYTAFDPH